MKIATSQHRIATAILSSAHKPGAKAKSTRKQLKHDMLLTFMAQSRKPKPRPAPKKLSFLRSVMAMFL